MHKDFRPTLDALRAAERLADAAHTVSYLRARADHALPYERVRESIHGTIRTLLTERQVDADAIEFLLSASMPEVHAARDRARAIVLAADEELQRLRFAA